MKRTGNHGFTLIELLITIVVLAVLMALAAPSFARLIASNRMATQTNEFIAGLHLARIEAVRRGYPVTIRADGGASEFHPGWRVFSDTNGDGAAASPVTADDGTVVRESGALSGNTTVLRVTRAGTSPTFTYTTATSSLVGREAVVFNARGATNGGTAAFFKVCDARDTGIQGRIVQVSGVGKISLDSTTESCS
jgi:type IV fimbrial biogenesis protein FimT